MSLNQQLKLQISTALDAAGIKATEAQIARMAQNVSAANKKMADGMTGTEKSLGRLPGAMGKLQSAFGGLAGKALAVVGAFKAGWEVGETLREKILRPLIPVYDRIFTAAEKAREAERGYKDELAKGTAEYEARIDRVEAASAVYEKAHAARMGELKEEAAGIVQLTAARDRMSRALDNAEDAQLERDRFEDVTMLRVQGFEKEAEAVERAYDVVKARKEAEQSLAAFDRENLKLTNERIAKEKELAEAKRRVAATNAEEDEAIRVQDKLIADEGTFFADDPGRSAYEKRLDKASKAARAATVRRKAAERAAAARERELAALDESGNSVALERATLVERNNIAIDRAAAAFDAYARENDAEIGEYIEHLVERVGKNADNSADSAALQETADNTRSLAEKLDQLLQMKD